MIYWSLISRDGGKISCCRKTQRRRGLILCGHNKPSGDCCFPFCSAPAGDPNGNSSRLEGFGRDAGHAGEVQEWFGLVWSGLVGGKMGGCGWKAVGKENVSGRQGTRGSMRRVYLTCTPLARAGGHYAGKAHSGWGQGLGQGTPRAGSGYLGKLGRAQRPDPPGARGLWVPWDGDRGSAQCLSASSCKLLHSIVVSGVAGVCCCCFADCVRVRAPPLPLPGLLARSTELGPPRGSDDRQHCTAEEAQPWRLLRGCPSTATTSYYIVLLLPCKYLPTAPRPPGATLQGRAAIHATIAAHDGGSGSVGMVPPLQSEPLIWALFILFFWWPPLLLPLSGCAASSGLVLPSRRLKFCVCVVELSLSLHPTRSWTLCTPASSERTVAASRSVKYAQSRT